MPMEEAHRRERENKKIVRRTKRMQCHGNPMKKEFQIEKSAKLCEMQK